MPEQVGTRQPKRGRRWVGGGLGVRCTHRLQRRGQEQSLLRCSGANVVLSTPPPLPSAVGADLGRVAIKEKTVLAVTKEVNGTGS